MQELGYYMRDPRHRTMRAFATATFGLRLALRLFGSRTMMEYYCSGGVLQYAFGHLTPIELLHVHRVREGERVANKSFS